MEIAVTDAKGLPEKTFLSIRVGDQRRQMQYRAGESFAFEPPKMPRHFTVDVFQKVGTKQVTLAELGLEGVGKGLGQVKVPREDGGDAIALDFKVAVKELSSPKRSSSRNQAALKAKSYLDGFCVQQMLQGMVQNMLSQQPESPVDFMTQYLEEHREECKGGSILGAKEADKAILPEPIESEVPQDTSLPVPPSSLESEVPQDTSFPPPPSSLDRSLSLVRFAADGSVALPSLTNHHSVMAEVLRKSTSLYESLKDVRTALGVCLATCIKTGVDNKGHKMIKTVGLVAGDEYCYDVFREVFDPVINRWHGHSDSGIHPCELDRGSISDEPIDATGKHVVSTHIRASRNLSGLRFPSAMSHDERLQVERLISTAASELPYEGEYEPLFGSTSFPSKPQGMTAHTEQRLREKSFLFEEPDSAVLISSGVARDWPLGRGVFASKDGQAALWVNEVEHLRILCPRADGNLKMAFETFLSVEKSIGASLAKAGYAFARSEHLGFLVAEPSNLGTSLECAVVLRLPLLSKEVGFKKTCRDLGVNARISTDDMAGFDKPDTDQWLISNSVKLGTSEATQVNSVISACRELIKMEIELGEGLCEDDQAESKVEAIGFPVDVCPMPMPDLQEKHSIAAIVLRNDPSIYERLREKSTPLGVSLATCIKPAMDNNGHPMIKTIGAVAGDEESYETFRELFEPIITTRHSNFDAVIGHTTDMDSAKVSNDSLDHLSPSGRVLSVKIRISRNLRGMRMPSACSWEERRKVEQIVVGALTDYNSRCASPDFQGTYYPLRGSSSFAAKPDGMSVSDENTLRARGLMLDAPDSEVKISSGFGRHWPDARGVFTTSNESGCGLSCFVNDEDHLRLTLEEPGADLKGVFARLCSAHQSIEKSLQSAGQNFAQSSRLGFLGTCPSNLGSCLAASVTLRLPLLSSEKAFRPLCKTLGLQVFTGGFGDSAEGLREISNALRLGSSEVDQVNVVIQGCRQLLEYESRLEKGEEGLFDGMLLAAPSTLSTPMNQIQKLTPMFTDASAPTTAPLTSSSRSGSKDLTLFAEIPGLGADDVPGFPADVCPDVLPDITNHHSLAVALLRENPELYQELSSLKTKLGTTLARCIKTGIDNKGHPMMKTIGVVAGDAFCYEVFSKLFDPVIRKRHLNFSPEIGHPTDMDWKKVQVAPADALQNNVLSVRIAAGRNLQNFVFSPGISKSDRREVERLIVQGLMKCSEGEYFPLQGSESYQLKHGGMDSDSEGALTRRGLLFQEPDALARLSTGSGRDWPDARGVFTTPDHTLAVWVNEEDHLRIISSQPGNDVRCAFEAFSILENELLKVLNVSSHNYAHSPNYGYLSVCPSNLGTGLSIEARIRLPKLMEHQDFKKLFRSLGLQVRRNTDNGATDVFDVSNVERLGCSEVELVELVATGIRRVLVVESQLTNGNELSVDDMMSLALPSEVPQERVPPGQRLPSPEVATHPAHNLGPKPGLGDADVPGFPVDDCPETLPDLSSHHSFLAEVLRQRPELYEKLRSLRTSSGVCLARCIKPGIDAVGHPMIKTIGLVAGDAECYDTFQDIFRPVIEKRHRVQVNESMKPTVLDVSLFDNNPIDPSGRYVVSGRLYAHRNLKGFRFVPAISNEKRKAVEGILTEALMQVGGNFEGQYLPLGPDGMSPNEREELDSEGLLFQEPDAALLLSSGIGRNWPESRGVFRSKGRTLAAWINEENHLRLTVTAPGGDGLGEAFRQFCVVENALQDNLRKRGHEFARSEQLGFLTTCPSHLGTGGMRLKLLMRIPLLSAQDDFKSFCKSLNLQVRPADGEGDGLWMVSTFGRLGVSEVDLVNQWSESCRKLVAREIELEASCSQ